MISHMRTGIDLLQRNMSRGLSQGPRGEGDPREGAAVWFCSLPGALCSLLGSAVVCWCVMFGHISGLEELLGSSIPHFLISLQASRC